MRRESTRSPGQPSRVESNPIRPGAPDARTRSHPDSYLTYRSQRLEEAVAHLRKELYTRIELRDRALQEIDYQIARAAHSLVRFTNWGLGYNVGVDVKRNMLEKQLADLRKERRQAELRGFGDITALRRDLRRTQDDLSAAERRRRIAQG